MYSWLSQGLALFAKTGGSVKVAHSLGEQNMEAAVSYATAAIQIGILFALLFGTGVLLMAPDLIKLIGISDPSSIQDSVSYARITCGLVIFSFMNMIFTGLFTAMGNSQVPFYANTLGLFINIFLDPVLIFGLGPFPRMGVTGAAIATVFAQFIVMSVFLYHILQDEWIFRKIRLQKWQKGPFYGQIIKIGFPTGIQNMIYSMISMVLSRLAAGFGDNALAVMRLGSQIESVSWVTSDGFNASLNAFVGQNYGARQYKRVQKGFYLACMVMLVWGVFSSCLLIFGAEPIFSLFISDQEVIPMGVTYLSILGFSQMFMCIEILGVGTFAGLGRTLPASVISITLTGMRIPLAVILTKSVLGLTGIWWAFTSTSIIKGIVFFVCCHFMLKKLVKNN